MSKKDKNDKFENRICKCGGIMIVREGLSGKESSRLSLKYTSNCVKCGSWYEMNKV